MTTLRENVEVVLGALPKLRLALTERSAVANVAGFVTGGSPSYELVSLSVEALLADVRREVDEFEQELRLDVGHNWTRVARLEDALGRLTETYEGAGGHLGAAVSASRALVGTERWVRRCRLVLGEIRAPYRLLWPDGSPVVCPVIEWRHDHAVGCDGSLLVHRDDATGVPAAIKCSRYPRIHAWTSGPAWLRLGGLLGGVP